MSRDIMKYMTIRLRQVLVLTLVAFVVLGAFFVLPQSVYAQGLGDSCGEVSDERIPNPPCGDGLICDITSTCVVDDSGAEEEEDDGDAGPSGSGREEEEESAYEQCINACGGKGTKEKNCSFREANQCLDLHQGEGGAPSRPGGDVGPSGSQTFGIPNPLKAESVDEILKSVAGFLFLIAIPLTTIFILLGAFQLLTSRGSEIQVAKGKKTITYAIVGFVIVFIAGGIATLIANILDSGT